jgi:secondary thiamine-phosphate synthase enzyme
LVDLSEELTVQSDSVSLRTRHEGEIVDITDKIQAIVADGKIRNGAAFLFVPGATAALTTLEYEPGLLMDLPDMLERIAPRTTRYAHEKQWHDGNGHSHVRASLMGPDLTVPIRERRLMLGTWQQIVFLELDIRPRDRTVIVQLIGE